jgi:hypothetical protein
MTNQDTLELSLRAEYEGAELGDKRRTKRLCDVAETIATNPGASFPNLFPDVAEREGAYRLTRNEKVNPEAMLRPHKLRTAERATQAKSVIVAHDTTEFNFGSNPREGLGRIGRGKSHGFYSHVSLTLANDEHRTPLGVAAMQIHKRTGKLKRRRKRATHAQRQTDKTNEGRRWLAGVEQTEEVLKDCPEILHVMDREADCYNIFDGMLERGARFVIRCAYDRQTVGDSHGKITRALAAAPVLSNTREVALSKRGKSPLPSYRKRHPPRKRRMATLSACAAPITVARPKSASHCPRKTLPLNAVRVWEENPPVGEQPIEWLLLTSEPISTPEEVWAVVDAYRARWVIEEYFKALKTGCAYESRQFESADNLYRALALFLPVAWWLLALRTRSRTDPEQPADTMVSPMQLRCLRAALSKLRVELPPVPSVRDALLGIARLGGHIPRNGEPGWIVISRGYHELLLLEQGFELADKKM